MDVVQISFNEAIEKVVAALKTAGYDPIAQLTGYIQTGDDTFITRTDDARAIIGTLSRAQIAEYIKTSK